jgi:DNA modification methylase
MELMRSFPDRYFDLAVVDPPYGIGISGNPVRQKHSKKSWDNNVPLDSYFKELFRVSQNQVIWGGNYFDLPVSQGFIVWDKKQPENFSLAMCEYAWISFQSPAKIFRAHVVTSESDRIHPTQKPVKLYDWIFKNYLPNGGKVLDTHGGSMSSVISAIKAGNIEMTCSELDKDYFRNAKDRILTFQSQLDMFAPPVDVIFHE